MSQEEDQWKTPEEIEQEKRLAGLEHTALDGALFESLKQHPAFLRWKAWMESELTDAKNKWLQTDDANEAQKLKYQMQGMLKAYTWIQGHVNAGKIASHGIKQFKEESEMLSQIVQEHLEIKVERQ